MICSFNSSSPYKIATLTFIPQAYNTFYYILFLCLIPLLRFSSIIFCKNNALKNGYIYLLELLLRTVANSSGKKLDRIWRKIEKELDRLCGTTWNLPLSVWPGPGLGSNCLGRGHFSLR